MNELRRLILILRLFIKVAWALCFGFNWRLFDEGDTESQFLWLCFYLNERFGFRLFNFQTYDPFYSFTMA